MIFFISAILFIALTLPFRFWLAASDITKMRPNTALTPVLGMIFGLPSSLGCAAGYFVSDMISGYEISYSFSVLYSSLFMEWCRIFSRKS